MFRGARFGDLARVPGLVVDVLEQRHQLVAEDLVVVRTAQPARVAELQERDLADRADLLVGRRRLAERARTADDQLLGQLAHRAAPTSPRAGPGAAGRARRRSGTRGASPSRVSVMWNVAGLAHFWHFMERLRQSDHNRRHRLTSVPFLPLPCGRSIELAARSDAYGSL